MPILLAGNRYQQELFVLKSSEADCLLGLDFPEDHHCDALFSSMKLIFPNVRTVPLFHSRKALSDPSPEQVMVIARETTCFPAGHEAVIVGELLTQSFPEKSEGIFEPAPAICEKNQVLAFFALCESEEMIPVRLINPVEDVTVYKGTSLESFSVVGSAEITAMSRVIADVPDKIQGQFPDKYDVKEVIKKLSFPRIHRFVHISRSSFVHFPKCSRNQNGIVASATLFSTGLTFTWAENR